jgi:hypothetical protein
MRRATNKPTNECTDTNHNNEHATTNTTANANTPGTKAVHESFANQAKKRFYVTLDCK